MQPDRSAELFTAVAELKRALQDAHFASRNLESLLPVVPVASRPADRVHALRIQAGELSRALRDAMAELPRAA